MWINDIIESYLDSMTDTAYGLLAALALATVYAVAWRLVTTPRRPAMTEPITATELACLRSDVAPVVTALAGLRASGRITVNRRVDRAVPAGAESDWFTEQILQMVADDPKHTVSSLLDASRGDLLALEKRLTARGLMRSPAERTRMRWGAAPAIMVMAAVIGYCVYLLTELSGHVENVVPVMTLVPLTVCYGLVVLPHLVRVNRATTAGRALLGAQQQRQAYLAPAQRPAFATYGPAAVAMSAALFGTAALWAIDADYSSTVELAGGSSDGGADGGSCGASCGGDGGGGGCGGGGCGGCGGCGG